ncbi:MAG: lysophospholipase L1-like esterase [Paraglaciecola sp.]
MRPPLVRCSLALSVLPAMQNNDPTKDWWLSRHQQKLAERDSMNKHVDLLFLGDSITHAWEYTAPKVWQQYYGQRRALNLGFDGDRTENLLWRIQNGAIDEICPKLVVLLIGTNNAGHRQEASKQTALGIKAILQELRSRLPQSKILLMALFPRSKKPSQQLRLLVDGTNQLIQHYADGEHILWKDINHHFVDEKGIVHESIMSDFLHPNATQYQVWAESIEAQVQALCDDHQ